MAAPTLVASVQIDSPWASAANISAGVYTKNYASTLSTTADDLIVVAQGGADGTTTGQLTASDGTNTYTQRTNLQNTGHCSLNIATAPDSAGGTRTITLTRANNTLAHEVGGIAFQFRAHGGVGNVVSATDGVQTGDLTCSANSAVVVIITDWGATTGTQSWATINGNAPTSTFGVTTGTEWVVAGAYWADVGAAGSKTITLSSPNFTTETFAAIEILGTGSAQSQAPHGYYFNQL